MRREASSSVVCKFSRADGTEPQTVLRALEMSSVGPGEQHLGLGADRAHSLYNAQGSLRISCLAAVAVL